MRPFPMALLASVCLLPAPALAACIVVPASQSEPAVKAFQIRPPSMLERNPFGGTDLANQLTFVLMIDAKMTATPAALLARSANGEQKRSIGIAFGTAIESCRRRGQTQDKEVLEKSLSTLNDTMVNAAYYARLNEMNVAISPAAATPSAAPDARRSGVNTGPLGSPFAPRRIENPLMPVAPIR